SDGGRGAATPGAVGADDGPVPGTRAERGVAGAGVGRGGRRLPGGAAAGCGPGGAAGADHVVGSAGETAGRAAALAGRGCQLPGGACAAPAAGGRLGPGACPGRT